MKQDKPLVAIVTITFNLMKAGREKYFRQNLESVRNQTYEKIEHIIIDGASTDGTVDLIKEYADKGWIKYISEPDTGIYDAMNKGVKMAKGKYIAFLNSDDFYHNPDAVKLSVEALEREQADFSYADYSAIYDADTRTMKGDINTFLYTMPFGHPTMFSKVSVIRSENGFNETYKVAADYDLIVRLILKDYRGIYIDANLMSFRMVGVCCNVDYSDEIAQINMKNYAPFYDFIDADQAKRIMFGMIIPEDFPNKFREFAKKQGLKNINIERVVSLLETKAKEHLQRIDAAAKSEINSTASLPKNFITKYIRLLLDSRFRQPVRRIYYAIRFKKLSE